MGIADFRNIFKNIEVPLSLFIILGITSFGIFIFGDRMWRNQFQRNIPLYDNLMQAGKNLTKGQLLFEKLLSGDQSVRIEDTWPFFEAALLSVKDSLNGRSTIIYLTGTNMGYILMGRLPQSQFPGIQFKIVIQVTMIVGYISKTVRR